ncbi:hypothetical protein DVH05_001654 [Phytophthora capsici]|nr:hypothetical protein DVH05_001654 [Phytophthora capsici]
MVRVRNSLTARQVRVRRRTEWQRQIKGGEVFWHQEISQECFQYPGYVVRFRKKDDGGDTAAEIEVAAALQDGEPGSIIMMLQREIRLMQIEAFPAEDTNGLEFATGSPSSTNVDVEGLIALSKDDFPTKFAHFVTCTSSLIVPAELEVLKLFLRREYVVEKSMEYLCCMDDKNTRSLVRIDFASDVMLQDSSHQQPAVHQDRIDAGPPQVQHQHQLAKGMPAQPMNS